MRVNIPRSLDYTDDSEHIAANSSRDNRATSGLPPLQASGATSHMRKEEGAGHLTSSRARHVGASSNFLFAMLLLLLYATARRG